MKAEWTDLKSIFVMTIALAGFVVILCSRPFSPPWITVIHVQNMEKETVVHMTAEVLQRAGVHNGIFHVSADRQRISDSAESISFCIASPQLMNAACAKRSFRSDEMFDASIVAMIVIEDELTEKLREMTHTQPTSTESGNKI